MNAAEDFLLLLLHTHTVAAAKTILDCTPVSSVSDLARRIVVNFVHLELASESEVPPPLSDSDEDSEDIDRVQIYASELLSLSLIWHGFHDSIREGDGDRIIRYWKVLLIIFKASNHYNYAKEAVTLLLQCRYIFSERQVAQLL